MPCYKINTNARPINVNFQSWPLSWFDQIAPVEPDIEDEQLLHFNFKKLIAKVREKDSKCYGALVIFEELAHSFNEVIYSKADCTPC